MELCDFLFWAVDSNQLFIVHLGAAILVSVIESSAAAYEKNVL